MTYIIDSAVILAAGRGTRLQPFTHDDPKGFLRVGEETLIKRSIRILKQCGIHNILLMTGHLHEHYDRLAREEGIDTMLSPEYATTGSCHTLILAQEWLQQDFLLLESDLLFEEKAITSLVNHEASDVVLCSGLTKSQDEVYVEFNPEGFLSNLSKQKSDLYTIDGELVGIWKISLDLFQELVTWHGANFDGRTIDYERALAALAKSGSSIAAHKINDLVWCEIDNQEHLERAINEVLPKL